MICHGWFKRLFFSEVTQNFILCEAFGASPDFYGADVIIDVAGFVAFLSEPNEVILKVSQWEVRQTQQ